MPPVALAVAVPVESPLHVRFVDVAVAVTGPPPTVMLRVLLHGCASVTVTRYVPGARPVKLEAVVLLFHLYLYGALPPVTVRYIDPLLGVSQSTLVTVGVTASGTNKVSVAVAVHPFWSVTVTW